MHCRADHHLHIIFPFPYVYVQIFWQQWFQNSWLHLCGKVLLLELGYVLALLDSYPKRWVVHLFITRSGVEEQPIRQEDAEGSAQSPPSKASHSEKPSTLAPFSHHCASFSTLICYIQICSFPLCVYITHKDLLYNASSCFIPAYNNFLSSAFYVSGILINAFLYFISVYNCVSPFYYCRNKYREVKSPAQGHTAHHQVKLQSLFFWS